MKKILILLFPVLFPIFSSAWNGTTPENFSKTIPASEFSCNLPAPANLSVSNITAHSATGSWSAVPGAVAYYVEVRIASNNSLVYSNTTGALTETATGLPAGEDLDFTVQAVCANGQISSATASKGFTTDVVIEVVIANYGTPCGEHSILEADIFYNVPDGDVFEGEILNGQEYWLEISQVGKNVNPVSFYKISYDEVGITAYKCSFQEILNAQYSSLGTAAGQNEQGSGNQSQTLFDKVVVSSSNYGENLLDIKMVGNYNQLATLGYVKVTATGPGWDRESGRYTIKLKTCSPGGGGDTRDRSDWADSERNSDSDINIFPNPVQSSLRVKFPETIEKQDIVNIGITDVNGKIVFQKSLTTVNEILEINMSAMQPGMYFLKIETGDDVRIFKVVKSE